MVSIIVPVYNLGAKVAKCLASIRRQSCADWECVVVNDGSTDDSLAVCRRFARVDSRFVIIDKKNEGVERARFDGLRAARGEHVTFVDGDDWMDRDTLQVMVAAMEKHAADYVEIGGRRILDGLGWLRQTIPAPVKGLVSQPELFDKYYISFFGMNILSVTQWGKLYRREAIDQARLEPFGLAMGEDLVFNMRLFPHLRSIYISDYVGYNYRFGGMTTRYNPRLFPDLKRLYLLKKQLIQTYHYDRARDYILYEIVNVLKSDIRQRLLFRYQTEEATAQYLARELAEPMWQDVRAVSNKKYLQSPMVRALLGGDAQAFLAGCRAEVKAEYPKWRLKRVASRLLSRL